MRGRNLLIAAAVLVVLVLLAVFIMREQPPEQITASFPEVKKDDVTKVWIKKPLDENKKDEEKKSKEEKPRFEEVILEKEGKGEDAGWMVTSPVRYEAYQSYIDTMLSRIEEMEIDAIAAEKKDSYADLEIDGSKRVEVKVFTGKTMLSHFFIGGYKGGATMVRFPDDEKVYRVRGSIRYIFAKAVRDWREKRILNIENDKVVRLEFSNENGTFAFSKVEGEWKNESETEIADYDAKKVNGFVSTVAHLRATDFEDTLKPDKAGLEENAGRVTIYYTEGEEEKKQEGKEESGGSQEEETAATESPSVFKTVIVGDKKDESSYYVMLEENPQIFLISKYTAERLRPTAEKFSSPPKKEEKKDETAKDLTATAKPADESSIPPDVMKKLQAEIKKQKLLKQLSKQHSGK